MYDTKRRCTRDTRGYATRPTDAPARAPRHSRLLTMPPNHRRRIPPAPCRRRSREPRRAPSPTSPRLPSRPPRAPPRARPQNHLRARVRAAPPSASAPPASSAGSARPLNVGATRNDGRVADEDDTDATHGHPRTSAVTRPHRSKSSPTTTARTRPEGSIVAAAARGIGAGTTFARPRGGKREDCTRDGTRGSLEPTPRQDFTHDGTLRGRLAVVSRHAAPDRSRGSGKAFAHASRTRARARMVCRMSAKRSDADPAGSSSSSARTTRPPRCNRCGGLNVRIRSKGTPRGERGGDETRRVPSGASVVAVCGVRRRRPVRSPPRRGSGGEEETRHGVFRRAHVDERASPSATFHAVASDSSPTGGAANAAHRSVLPG